MRGARYIVICQQAWCNERGFGIEYGWDGEEFSTRPQAIKHGWSVRGSDDFNIGVVKGRHLVSFDWMNKPVGEDDAAMATIAEALGLKFRAAMLRPAPYSPATPWEKSNG